MPEQQQPRPVRDLSNRVLQPLQNFLNTEASGGVLLLVSALLAIVWANSPWSDSYGSLWAIELRLGFGDGGFLIDLHHLVNDGLMALFFLVVGLEIKREVLAGELKDRRAAAVPVVAAVGGMVVPALLYLSVNAGSSEAHGWGIPMATDIAFALGVLTVAARLAPPGLKSFLLTLAIVDDIGAIAVIALFYSSGVEPVALLMALVVVAAIAILRRVGVVAPVVYLFLGPLLWFAVYSSGVHATIAGVVLALLTPARPVGHRGDEVPEDSPLTRLESRLHPYTSFLIVPIFALANAGVHLTGDAFMAALESPVTLGVILGLVVGKSLGVSGAAWLAVRSGLGVLPDRVTWTGIVGAAALAGIGFTVALFVAELAFDDPVIVAQAKVGILLASLVAGILGFGLLRRVRA